MSDMSKYNEVHIYVVQRRCALNITPTPQSSSSPRSRKLQLEWSRRVRLVRAVFQQLHTARPGQRNRVPALLAHLYIVGKNTAWLRLCARARAFVVDESEGRGCVGVLECWKRTEKRLYGVSVNVHYRVRLKRGNQGPHELQQTVQKKK